MRLSRNLTLWVHFALDQCLPPLVRDSRWFMRLPLWLAAREQTELLLTFKDRAPTLTPAEFAAAYRQLAHRTIDRETDLNTACVEAIDAAVVGSRVLDAGCGRGWLTRRLAQRFTATGLDIVIDPELARSAPSVRWVEGATEELPFEDGAFDTVVCAHTLEHVLDLPATVRELRRVAAKRLIVVVPRQRPYRYTFDLHLHFFPMASSLRLALGRAPGFVECSDRGGDWFYVEDRP
ncbi:MAG: class I SAM-dependent methyltransferase [Myxococcota bacterium]